MQIYFGRSLLIQINLYKFLNYEYGLYDLIKIFGFNLVKENLIGFALKEGLVQIYFIQYLLYKEDSYSMKRVNLDVLVHIWNTMFQHVCNTTSGLCQQAMIDAVRCKISN